MHRRDSTPGPRLFPSPVRNHAAWPFPHTFNIQRFSSPMIASLLSRFGRLSSRLALASALAMALGLSSLLPSGPAQAYESRYVYKADGSPMFELRFFDQGETFYYMPNEGDDCISAWTLPEEQKNSAVEAASLWADVLGSASRNTSPLTITTSAPSTIRAYGPNTYSTTTILPLSPL